MKKKLKYGLSAVNKDTPKWVYYSTAIIALAISAKHHVISGLPLDNDELKGMLLEWASYVLEIAQVVLAVAVIFIGYDHEKPDTDQPSWKPGSAKAIILLLIAGMLFLSGCAKKTLEQITTSSKTDSTWVEKKQVPVPVKGGQTPTVNMDSLKRVLQEYMQLMAVRNPEGIDNNIVPPEIINKIYTIPDTSGRYELQYWINASGELMAKCQAKDTTIMALVDQVNRLVRENKNTTSTKIIYKTPGWVKGFIGGIIILIIAAILFGVIRSKKKISIGSWLKK